MLLRVVKFKVYLAKNIVKRIKLADSQGVFDSSDFNYLSRT